MWRLNHSRLQPRDQPAVRIVEIGTVSEISRHRARHSLRSTVTTSPEPDSGQRAKPHPTGVKVPWLSSRHGMSRRGCQLSMDS
jgi:hypothetical protein